MDKLVLIDGNSIAFRAFFALPLLKSRQGTYTNAVYGFTMMLMKVLEEEKPSHVLVAFDAGKFTFRHRDYKDYKGKRDKTPGEFSEQIPLIKRLLDAFGIRHFELEQYEADDIIGTLARQAEGAGIAVTIVTGDKDLLQLVSDRVHLLMTKKGVSDADRYDLHRIEERYGLKPEQIIDLKGLMGDPSDNIPGIPGVGEKTALKLLHQYGSVEKVLDNIDNLPGKKLKERVAENRRDALLSKELATIFCEVPLDFGINDLKYEGYDTGRVTPILKELEFKSLLERIGGSDAKEKPGETEEIAVEMVSPEETRNWDEWLSQDGLALFVEMSDENYHRAEVLAVALSDGKKQLFLEWGTAREWPSFRRWLQDPDRTKVCYDVKATGVALKHQGLETDGFAWDILLSSYLINASESGHELSEIVDRKWGGGLPDDDAVYGKGVKRRRPEGKELAEHLARKARAIHRLQPVLEEELKENGLDSLYFDLELPLARVLAKMEWQGVQVDRERLQSLGEELQVRLDELTEKIYDLAGAKFNINSPKQLGEILFDKLGLPVLKKTKTGYSTSADVLEKLAPQHEIVEEILHYRQVGKLISTYVEGLLKEIRRGDRENPYTVQPSDHRHRPSVQHRSQPAEHSHPVGGRETNPAGVCFFGGRMVDAVSGLLPD